MGFRGNFLDCGRRGSGSGTRVTGAVRVRSRGGRLHETPQEHPGGSQTETKIRTTIRDLDTACSEKCMRKQVVGGRFEAVSAANHTNPKTSKNKMLFAGIAHIH
jgi:hypothetical protein